MVGSQKKGEKLGKIIVKDCWLITIPTKGRNNKRTLTNRTHEYRVVVFDIELTKYKDK